MTLNYDFDVYSEIPRGIFSEKTKTRPAKTVDGHSYWDRHKVVMFRDPKTVKAFHEAPQKIRKIFQDSHFSANRSYSRVPRGYYLESDHAFRTEIFSELEKHLNSQLSQGELNVALKTDEIAPSQRKYAFHNRLNKKAKSLKVDTHFNVGEFINAAYAAKSVAVPTAIAEKLSPKNNSKKSTTGVFAFMRAAAPRLAFIFYMFAYSTTQVNAASWLGL